MSDPAIDNDNLDSFVVSNTHYYRSKWQKIVATPASMLSFNWAASFGQVFWLAYRKLYLPLVWAVVAYIAYVALWFYVDDKQLISTNVSAVSSWAVSILFFAVFGLLGNYWYWRRFRKVERQAMSRYSDRDSQLRFLRTRGGTAPLVAAVIVAIFLLPAVWAFYWGVYKASQYDFSEYVFDASGPLTLQEVQSNFLAFMDEPLEGTRKECVFREVEKRALAAGDPETLDPVSVEFLPVDYWSRLDPDGKRIILMQAITTKALFLCER